MLLRLNNHLKFTKSIEACQLRNFTKIGKFLTNYNIFHKVYNFYTGSVLTYEGNYTYNIVYSVFIKTHENIFSKDNNYILVSSCMSEILNYADEIHKRIADKYDYACG